MIEKILDTSTTRHDTFPLQTDETTPFCSADRRSQLEPPMPGYKGYIPRIYVTEMGLGCRYNNMTRNGLHMFKAEQDAHFEAMRHPINVKVYVFLHYYYYAFTKHRTSSLLKDANKDMSMTINKKGRTL